MTMILHPEALVRQSVLLEGKTFEQESLVGLSLSEKRFVQKMRAYQAGSWFTGFQDSWLKRCITQTSSSLPARQLQDQH